LDVSQQTIHFFHCQFGVGYDLPNPRFKNRPGVPAADSAETQKGVRQKSISGGIAIINRPRPIVFCDLHMKLPKRRLLLTIPLAVVSLEIYLGMLAGYAGAFFIAGKKPEGRAGSNHWCLIWAPIVCISTTGCSVLGFIPLAVHYNLFFLSGQFCIGLMGGVVYQGVTSYNDWYRVLFKRKQ